MKVRESDKTLGSSIIPRKSRKIGEETNLSLVFPLAFVTITVGRGVGSIVRQRGEGGSRRMPRQQQRPPLGGARAGHPKGKDGVERGARAGYTGERGSY